MKRSLFTSSLFGVAAAASIGACASPDVGVPCPVPPGASAAQMLAAKGFPQAVALSYASGAVELADIVMLNCRTEVLQLAEQALQQAGQAEVLAQLRDELRRLASGGPFAGATVIQQQSGGANLGVGNTIGSVGDVVAGSQTRGSVDNQGRIAGVAVGVNLGTIVYGRTPQEDERRRLVWYLDRLAAKLYRLPVRGLDEKLEQGKGVALPQVYVMLATENRTSLYAGLLEHLAHWFEDNDPSKPLGAACNPDYVLPHEAVVDTSWWPADPHMVSPNDTQALLRATLVTEAVQQHQHLILLGDPGSGKSTFLRHLAWALARRGLDQDDAPLFLGWDERHCVLPVILSLRNLAGRLTHDPSRNIFVHEALHDEMKSYGITQVEDMLNAALDKGAALLLFDGLDEVPIEGIPDQVEDRRTTLEAVRYFAELNPRVRCVVTCRTRALDEGLRRAVFHWDVKTIAPFTLGQIRHFIPAWYNELVHCGQITPLQAERMGQLLLEPIVASPKLRAMAENPLLLTMMALVLYNKGELPRDRPQLYERILELLLGQWDKVRDGQSLAEAIGVPDWGSERLRPLLDQLSFQAHAGATSADGRGRLARRDVREALERFFIQAGMRDDQAAAASVRCLDYFNHRSGLLVPDTAQDSYVFAHLTLQEHSAGRALALDPDAAALVMQHRADDRWREPIFLGLGVAQQINPALLDRVLSDLIDEEEAGHPKLAERRQRDLIFAAEIGNDRDWGYLRTQRVNVDRLQRDLRRGLVALLADQAQPLPVAERVRAGFLLGDLGDARVPVTLDDWRRELAKVATDDTSGYFCKVEAGTYTIGSADDDPDAKGDEKPQHQVTFDTPFWIARFPITNAQWQIWMSQGDGNPSYYADDVDLNRPNQPVVGVQWGWCNDFSAWLSAQLDAELCLPTEFEWEAAARGGDARRYPWGDEWQDDRAATGEDQETRGSQYTVPVGCYPAGAAPCGALDMSGNVWEWTASEYRSYPEAAKPFTDYNYRVLRGGYYKDIRKRVRCGARGGIFPNVRLNVNGFRIVVAPRAH